eukprot:2623259-Pyramimonas_sp.AAC.1
MRGSPEYRPVALFYNIPSFYGSSSANNNGKGPAPAAGGGARGDSGCAHLPRGQSGGSHECARRHGAAHRAAPRAPGGADPLASGNHTDINKPLNKRM